MIDITERAAQALLAVMARTDQPAAGVRIVAGPDGGSGLSYSLGLVGEGTPEDNVITAPRGISLFVDGDSLPHLMGSTLDYQETESGHAFTFLNPNDCPHAQPETPEQPKSCGCGKSSCSA